MAQIGGRRYFGPTKLFSYYKFYSILLVGSRKPGIMERSWDLDLEATGLVLPCHLFMIFRNLLSFSNSQSTYLKNWEGEIVVIVLQLPR